MSINRPESALVWSFWSHSCGCVKLALEIALLVWSLAYFKTSIGNSSLTYLFCVCGCVFSARASTMVTSHLWTLPISTTRLAAVMYGYAFVLPVLLCLVMLGGLNWLGAQWPLAEAAFVVGLVSVLALILASCLSSDVELDGQESLLVCFFAFVVIDLMGIAPGPMFTRIDAVHTARWPIMMVVAVGLFGWLYSRIDCLRRSRTTIRDRIRRWDISIADLSRQRLTTPASPYDAIVELDWRRAEELAIVAMALLVVLPPGLSFFLESDLLLAVWAWFGFMGLLATALAAHAFVAQDRQHNGAFRWTLPVSDKELAYGILRALFRLIAVGFMVWVTGLVVLTFVGWYQGQFVFDRIEFRNLGLARSISLVAVLGVIAVVGPWIYAGMALVNGYIHGCRGTMILAVTVASPICLILFCEWVIPEDFQRLFVQLEIASAGLLMLASTIRVFRYAIERGFVTSRRYSIYCLLWGVSVMACSAAILILGLGVGSVVLCGGLLSLAFHPLASMPIVISNARHWWI